MHFIGDLRAIELTMQENKANAARFAKLKLQLPNILEALLKDLEDSAQLQQLNPELHKGISALQKSYTSLQLVDPEKISLTNLKAVIESQGLTAAQKNFKPSQKPIKTFKCSC